MIVYNGARKAMLTEMETDWLEYGVQIGWNKKKRKQLKTYITAGSPTKKQRGTQQD